MIAKTLPHAVIDRQAISLTFDGEELPFYYAEEGPRAEPYAEGLSVVWVPVLVESVEEIEADESRLCDPALWKPRQPAVYTDVVERGGRVLASYRGDS